MCATPFRIIENPYFISVLKNLQPNYNPPSRERLTTDLLSEESIRTEIKVNNYIEKEKNLTLGIKKYLKILYEYNGLIYSFYLISSRWLDKPEWCLNL